MPISCVIWDILCAVFVSFYAVVDCSCQSPVSLLPVSCVIGDIWILSSVSFYAEGAEVAEVAEDS